MAATLTRNGTLAPPALFNPAGPIRTNLPSENQAVLVIPAGGRWLLARWVAGIDGSKAGHQLTS